MKNTTLMLIASIVLLCNGAAIGLDLTPEWWCGYYRWMPRWGSIALSCGTSIACACVWYYGRKRV